MKLYKFRSLEKIERIRDILFNSRFHLARWKELNDPMEGFFHYIIYDTELPYKERIRQFINEKNELKICSFSNTFHPILLWSHYANHHKGIAIEITVNPDHYSNLYKVKYGKNIPELNFDLSPSPIDVLKSKINHWAYEREYRVIDRYDTVTIEKITGIYFGLRVENEDKERIKLMVNSPVHRHEGLAIGSGLVAEYKVQAFNNQSHSDFTNVVSISTSGFYKENSGSLNSDIALDYQLFQNYPNPFNPSTSIGYQIKETEFVSLKIFDVLGNEVKTLVNEIKTPGIHYVDWEGDNNYGEKLSSGIYFYSMKTATFIMSKKLILQK